MRSFSEMTLRTARSAALPLALILLLGAGLRLFQLGADGLWFDEVGVALALRAPDPLAMTAAIRAHVAAMPLDYWVAWLVSRACATETCLRLPAAVWGTLALWAGYFLFRRVAGERVARLAVLLLAITPLAIAYSQELRFYAALLFFYTAGVALLLRAIETDRGAHWAQFAAVAILGFYFHVYVALVFVPGLFALLTRPARPARERARWLHFAAAGLAVGAAALPGYLAFRPTQYDGMFSPVEALVGIWIGLGWFPGTKGYSPAVLPWYLLAFLLQVGGALLAVRRGGLLRAMVWSILAQVGLIFVLNLGANYALRGRQLLFLQPLLCLLMANFLDWILARLNAAGPRLGRWGALALAVTGLLAIAAALAVGGYYAGEKSRRRELAQTLAALWQPGDAVWLTPAWESDFYGYYLERLGQPQVVPALQGRANVSLPGADGAALPRCWVTPRSLGPAEQDLLAHHGYTRIDLDAERIPDAQLLWCRPPGAPGG